jgi:hypothetical protein
MKNIIRCVLLVTVIALVGLAPRAFADTVNLSLSGSQPNGIYDGKYIAPYSTNEGPQLICDDDMDSTYLGVTTAFTVNSFAASQSPNSGTGLLWGSLSNEAQIYNAMAWLAEGLLAAAENIAKEAECTFAI